MLGGGQTLADDGAVSSRGRNNLTDGGLRELLVRRTLLQDGAERREGTDPGRFS